MIKRFCQFLIVLIPVLNCSAQHNSFMTGVEAGPALVNFKIKSPYPIHYNNAVRFSGSVFIQYDFKGSGYKRLQANKDTEGNEPSVSFFSIRSEIGYERKGGVIKVVDITDTLGNSYGPGKMRVYASYMTVPLLLRFTIGKKWKVFVNTGPYLGFLLNAAVTAENDQVHFRTENKNDYKKTDIGAALGLGISKVLANKRIIFSLEERANIGLTDNYKQTGPDFKGPKTRALNFFAGIGYRL